MAIALSHPEDLSWNLCRALCHKAGGDLWQQALTLLPERIRKGDHATSQQEELLLAPLPAQDVLEKFDPSWAAALLRSLPQEEMRCLLACFSETSEQLLRRRLKAAFPLPALSPLATRYMTAWMVQQLSPPEGIMPIQLFAASPLYSLWEEPLERLHKLPWILGMRDVAAEAKKLIDNAKRRQLQGALSKELEEALGFFSYQMEMVLFRPIELSAWNGDREALEKVILQRGCNRLAKALTLEPSALVWHITRRFPVEVTHSLEKLYQPRPSEAVAATLRSQTLEALHWLHRRPAGEKE